MFAFANLAHALPFVYMFGIKKTQDGKECMSENIMLVIEKILCSGEGKVKFVGPKDESSS